MNVFLLNRLLFSLICKFFVDFRKKNAEKLEELRHEYEMRLHHVTTTQKSNEQLQERLAETESQLDKAIAQIVQMERMNKSQVSFAFNH